MINYKIGLDIGSTTVKLVVLNNENILYIVNIKDIFQI